MGRKKGVALIVVMVMVLVFLSIIVAVVLSATSAIRHASYTRDKLIALQIAESGIQDCLYWMNYKGYWNHHYPSYWGSLVYFRGSDYAGTDTWVSSEVWFQPGGFPEGKCSLRLEDRTGYDTDRIISTGVYRGRTATMELRLRGWNGQDNPRHTSGGLFLCDWDATKSEVANWGIPEVFNKHAIYSYRINPSSGTVNGNITYHETSIAFPALSGRNTRICDKTMVETMPPWCYFPVPEVLPSFPSFPPVPGTFNLYFDKTTDQNGNRWDTYYRYGNVNTGTKTWYFDNSQSPPAGQVINQSIRLEWGGNPPGDLRIQDENNGRIFTSYLLASDGAIYFETSLTVSGPGAVFSAQNGLSFSSGITFFCQNDGILHLNRASSGNVTMTGVTVKDGPVFTGSGITSLSLTSCTLDASASSEKRALLISSGTASLINCTVKGQVFTGTGVSSLSFSGCTLDGTGRSDKVALIASAGSVSLTNCTVKGMVRLEGSGTLTLDNTTVVADPSGENCYPAVITRGKLVVRNNSQVKGLALVLGTSGSSDTNLQSGTIEGAIASRGELSLSSTTVNYSGRLLWKESSIFSPFIGGRRVYVPVAGSWRIY